MALITHMSRYQGVMGSVLDLTLDAETEADARQAEVEIIDEILRLQQIFDVHRTDSEISEWRRSERDAGPELREVLALALRWMDRTSGAFNPAVGALKQMWVDAEETQIVPDGEQLAAAAADVASPPYTAGDGRVVAVSPRVEAVDLNAIAKGWIVDRAAALGLDHPGIVGLTVNAGGDLLHRSARTLTVGIDDPRHPYDNVASSIQVGIDEGAIASSGGSRRFWRIGGDTYGHVLDPRTGRPVDHVLSVSVFARDAATADVVATVLTVLEPSAGVEFADRMDGIGALTMCRDGSLLKSQLWETLEM